MAENTKYILMQIKLQDGLKDLIAKSDGENVQVNYNGGSKTLDAALAEILTAASQYQTQEQVSQAIKAAIDDLIDGAPDTYDTLKEIADYIKKDESAASAITQQIAGKLDTTVFDTFKGEISKLGALAGKDQVAEADLEETLAEKINTAATGNHTHANKAELDKIQTGDVQKWNDKADKTEASASAAGLMSADDKKRLDAIRGVRMGDSAPEDMLEGELFVQIVSAE